MMAGGTSNFQSQILTISSFLLKFHSLLMESGNTCAQVLFVQFFFTFAFVFVDSFTWVLWELVNGSQVGSWLLVFMRGSSYILAESPRAIQFCRPICTFWKKGLSRVPLSLIINTLEKRPKILHLLDLLHQSCLHSGRITYVKTIT